MRKWIDEIDAATRDFQETFGELNTDQLNWRPDSKTWSIAQNIDHLIVYNESYFPVIKSLKKGTYETPLTARIGLLVSLFGSILMKAVKPDRKIKVKTFSLWEPTQSEIPPGIMERFREHQAVLKKEIEQSHHLVKEGAVISSPANKYIVYKLKTAFDLIVTHEQRHFEQAKEVFRLMETGGSR